MNFRVKSKSEFSEFAGFLRDKAHVTPSLQGLYKVDKFCVQCKGILCPIPV
jgi:hypothetical protein